MLWITFFLKIANIREYIIIHCNSQRKLDRLLREWYLNQKPNDDEMRAFDDNLNDYYIVCG